ncbi:uncharacterized protein MYCGRDRAFT_97634 [Zymoseptoria tritici IPO323]|uniref:Uncharacterized protein n=1 Tax=Zymoseptoria tritici (strain CBS 115943 / IPO323) TaxID=336722 RepID=F9XR27_ZYMTI|nr:uncharacterized protein MYCGRDRAFT_97634 [Zymoseptoria tritici IPO323]EGP82289.1 hypothetical protein MYCGRDRAFT_97634 [Zymoseptoria tritici IPO323]
MDLQAMSSTHNTVASTHQATSNAASKLPLPSTTPISTSRTKASNGYAHVLREGYIFTGSIGRSPNDATVANSEDKACFKLRYHPDPKHDGPNGVQRKVYDIGIFLGNRHCVVGLPQEVDHGDTMHFVTMQLLRTGTSFDLHYPHSTPGEPSSMRFKIDPIMQQAFAPAAFELIEHVALDPTKIGTHTLQDKDL